VRIWDPTTGTCRHTLTGHTDIVNVLAIAPDGTWLASAGNDNTVRIWHAFMGRPCAALRVGYPLTVARWTSDSGIAVGGHRGPYFLKIHPAAVQPE